MDDFWKEMVEDILKIGIMTYGIIAIAIIIVGIGAKILQWLGGM